MSDTAFEKSHLEHVVSYKATVRKKQVTVCVCENFITVYVGAKTKFGKTFFSLPEMVQGYASAEMVAFLKTVAADATEDVENVVAFAS